MNKYDYLVFIGRFQPVHKGHIHVIREALKLADKLILVIGSDKKAPDIRNPFSTSFRINLIEASLTQEEVVRINYAPQVDYTYNDDRWIAAVQASVSAITHAKWKPGPVKIGIIGYDKDHTSYYLKKFPQWPLVPVEPVNILHSTDFRKKYFAGEDISEFCETELVKVRLNLFKQNSEYTRLKNEFEFVKLYKSQWKDSPYPPTFVTVDAVVRQAGHLLLVKRKASPGEGLWALPGGFVNQTETLEQAVLRELKEETNIDIPIPALKGSIVNRMTFDEPHRSVRGRTISEAFDFKLNDNYALPKVKGSDDASEAFWVPFADLIINRDKFFEDHFSIIQCMVGL